MKTYTYTILLEGRDDDGGGWTGLVPDLPGLLLMGDTRDELLSTASDAIVTTSTPPSRCRQRDNRRCKHGGGLKNKPLRVQGPEKWLPELDSNQRPAD